MFNCYVCDSKINSINKSTEHIFLNSIGGRLKSDSLICQDCNSQFGKDIDANLSKDLNFFSNRLNIKRDNGQPQKIVGRIKDTGEKFHLKAGGKPVISKPLIKEIIEKQGARKHVSINVQARDRKELRKILLGLRRKYPKLDITECLRTFEDKLVYPDDSIMCNFSIGGNKAFRSICKMAVNFYLYRGGCRENIAHLVPYLKSDIEGDFVYYFYPEVVVIPSKGEDEVLHSIIIQGDHNQRILYAYIELFNALKFVIMLNNQYKNDDFTTSYFFDVLKRTEVKKEFCLNVQAHELENILRDKPDFIESLKNHIWELNKIFYRKQLDDFCRESFDKAYKRSIGEYPEGTELDERIIGEFVEELMKELTPLIVRSVKDRRRDVRG